MIVKGRRQTKPAFTRVKSDIKRLKGTFYTNKSKMENYFDPSNPSNGKATFIQSTRMQLFLILVTCHVGIHSIALAKYLQMSTHMPGILLCFASFLLGKLNTSTWVNRQRPLDFGSTCSIDVGKCLHKLVPTFPGVALGDN